jgi:hypothetical protein
MLSGRLGDVSCTPLCFAPDAGARYDPQPASLRCQASTAADLAVGRKPLSLAQVMSATTRTAACSPASRSRDDRSAYALPLVPPALFAWLWHVLLARPTDGRGAPLGGPGSVRGAARRRRVVVARHVRPAMGRRWRAFARVVASPWQRRVVARVATCAKRRRRARGAVSSRRRGRVATPASVARS